MKDVPAPTRNENCPPSPTGRTGAILRYFRVGFITLIVIAAYYLAYGFGNLWAEWREALRLVPTRVTPASIPPALNPLVGTLPLAGPWSFGDLEWNLRTSTIKRDKIAERFEQLVKSADEAQVDGLPDVSADLLEIADLLHLVPEDRGAFRIYRLDRPDLKAELISRDVASHSKAVAIACALPQEGDSWQLFELTPRSASPKPGAQEAHLLPLPASAVRRGGRFADDGQLLLELVTLESTPDALIAAWRQAGWEVRPSGLAGVTGFSFLCGRGNDFIYAWSANTGESVQNLMLVRSPTDAELQAQQLIPKE